MSIRGKELQVSIGGVPLIGVRDVSLTPPAVKECYGKFLAKIAQLPEIVLSLDDVPPGLVASLGGDMSMEMNFRSTRKVWVFPQERFVQYEKSDEDWCRFFGIGHEADQVIDAKLTGVSILKHTSDSITFQSHGGCEMVPRF